MISTLTPHLQLLVESICEKGCERVSGVIDAYDKQMTIEEIDQLDELEKVKVLVALKNIMSVYDQ